MVFEICIEKQKPRKLLTYRVLTNLKNVVRGLDETRTRDPLRDRQVF